MEHASTGLLLWKYAMLCDAIRMQVILLFFSFILEEADGQTAEDRFARLKGELLN